MYFPLAGLRCEEKADACERHSCMNGARCAALDSPGREAAAAADPDVHYACDCPPGFS